MNDVTRITRKLVTLSALLAFCVILLGAWTRLSDAGLGCPDWPGCYGHFTVPTDADALARAKELFPEQIVVAEKAWPEMIHRHFAKALGLLLTITLVLAWKNRRKGHPVMLPTALFVLVCFQGALGAWTVTLKLWPVVVMSHLLGGMLIFSLLCVLALQLHGRLQPKRISNTLRRVLLASGALVFVQVALGGWTSANYAALACTELPICQSEYLADANFGEAFKLHWPGEKNYEFGLLEHDARVAIHATHRVGAWTTLAVVGWLSLMLFRAGGALRLYGSVMGGLLCAQIALGISNVVLNLPLPIAVAHNGVGIFLFMLLLVGNVWLWRRNTALGGEQA